MHTGYLDKIIYNIYNYMSSEILRSIVLLLTKIILHEMKQTFQILIFMSKVLKQHDIEEKNYNKKFLISHYIDFYMIYIIDIVPIIIKNDIIEPPCYSIKNILNKF